MKEYEEYTLDEIGGRGALTPLAETVLRNHGLLQSRKRPKIRGDHATVIYRGK